MSKKEATVEEKHEKKEAVEKKVLHPDPNLLYHLTKGTECNLQ